MEESEKQPTTLKGIIDKNHVLLSTAGVLIALAAFLGSLPISWIAYLLSFLMLTGFMLLWSEIKIETPTNLDIVTHLKIIIFRWLLRTTFLLVLLFILLRYRSLSHYFLTFPLILVFMVIFIKTIQKSKRLIAFMKSPGKISKIVTFIIVIALMVASFFLASVLSPTANIVLDYIAKIK